MECCRGLYNGKGKAIAALKTAAPGYKIYQIAFNIAVKEYK